MAEIKAFRAWRYNDELCRRIDRLISPLFDVASEKQRSACYAEPCNSIHLSIPAGKQPARSAAATLKKWIARGYLQRDPVPGIYAYYQHFFLPGHPGPLCRKGFICRIRLYEWHEGVILRHENTMPAAVNEQAELLAATRMNVSPTHGLYSDADFELEGYLDACMRKPLCEAEDFQGTRHVLGIIRDPQIIARFVDKLHDKTVILADGHHRYAGSLAYRQRRAAADRRHSGREEYNYHLMWLTNTEARDLKILPTHRLIRGLEPFDEAALCGKFELFFSLRPVPDPVDTCEAIAGKPWTFGVLLPGGAFCARLKPGLIDTIRWKFPPEIKRLDLTVMHYFIIQEILGIPGPKQSASACIGYERSFAVCLERVMRGDVQMALITNEIPVETVKQVCASGHTLPSKSTYFYPKAVCGLIFCSI